MNHSTPGLPVHHQLLESTQTHVELMMPSNHLILCCPLLLLPSIFPSIGVFSNESALCIRWPKYWSFSFNISLYRQGNILRELLRRQKNIKTDNVWFILSKTTKRQKLRYTKFPKDYLTKYPFESLSVRWKMVRSTPSIEASIRAFIGQSRSKARKLFDPL